MSFLKCPQISGGIHSFCCIFERVIHKPTHERGVGTPPQPPPRLDGAHPSLPPSQHFRPCLPRCLHTTQLPCTCPTLDALRADQLPTNLGVRTSPRELCNLCEIVNTKMPYKTPQKSALRRGRGRPTRRPSVSEEEGSRGPRGSAGAQVPPRKQWCRICTPMGSR